MDCPAVGGVTRFVLPSLLKAVTSQPYATQWMKSSAMPRVKQT